MQISSNGVDLIASFEGCRLEAYKDVAGVWTIGYGHTAGVQPGQTISQERARQYLEADIANFVSRVNRAITTKIITFEPNQNQFDALVSFAFNLGAGCVTTLCRDRNAEQVADAMLLYCKAGGKVIESLKKRREKERELFLTPVGGKVKVEKKVEEPAKKVVKKDTPAPKATSIKKTTTKKSAEPKCPFRKPAKTIKAIEKGASGENVKWIQWQLNNKISAGLPVNGVFDDGQ